MNLSFSTKKTAVVLALAMTLFFLSGCRKNDPDISIQEYKPSVTEAEHEKVLMEITPTEVIIQDTEPLAHSIKSTIDIDDINPVVMLGEYRTYYGDSSEARAVNIENAAKKIDGTVLEPGEVFSCRDVIAPFTEKNGYKPAGTYCDGKITQSIGGGVCQISTTLYNAVLFAELKIVERTAHSMTVSYVDLSMDAAIAEDIKDFKFENSLPDPITIYATTEDGWLIFEIEGTETRVMDREIKFETVILSKSEPDKDVITIDESQADNYYKVTQKAHTGYEAELYKVVYENGIETERVLINKSNYKSSPQYVTKGKK